MSFSASFLSQGRSVIHSLWPGKGSGANRKGKTEGQGRREEKLGQQRNKTVSSPSLGAFKHLMGIWQIFSSLSQGLVL